MTPRVLLLQEDQVMGGVTTIAKALCKALQRQGWSITTLVLGQSRWRQLMAGAWHCNVILASNNFRSTYVAWTLGLLLRRPVVVWVHGPLQEVLAQADASSLKRGWLRWLYRHILYFVFVSRTSRDSFESSMKTPWAPRQRSVVIPNSVAVAAPATLVPARNDPTQIVRLAYIGRLSAEKQPALLLDMLRRLPPRFRLTLVGDGPLREELQRIGADLLACGRLTLAGTQSHGPDLYRPWDLTLLASRYEGCPMTLLESLAVGVPCITLPIPAVRELLHDDAPDLLAKGHSAEALADAVQAAWDLPRQKLRESMARVLSRHKESDFVERWQAVLQNAASRNEAFPCDLNGA